MAGNSEKAQPWKPRRQTSQAPERTWDVWRLRFGLEAEERQRVDSGGCSRRRVPTSGRGVARVEPHGGVDAAKQRAQVEVPQRRHQGVGDGVGSATDARDGGVDVLDPVAEVEGV